MPTTTPQKLAELQGIPENIRNICILAHVDHGKTTLADALVASNGIISQRMAGKLRYLDSREDEQLRGITMKSSAISLQYNEADTDYLINLIDSPGHIDFSSEVSTAVRLCDGAIVVLDAVEGVCPQTQAVLRQAWLEYIKPVLVINKIDRIITELKLTPLEAHQHLQQLLEQVNAVMGELFSTNIYAKNAEKETHQSPTSPKNSEEKLYDWSVGLDDTDDSHLYFSPDLGNVVFASATDGWGFSVNHFAAIFSKKLGVKPEILQKTLWGDYFLNNKTKRIMKGAQAKGKKPMFVQFVLENIWSVYDAVSINRDKVKIEKIVNSLNLKVNSRDLTHSDHKVPLLAICKQWLPLSDAVLSMVAKQLPSPISMASERIEKLMCSSLRRFDSLPQETQKLKNDFIACSPADDANVIVFISKMFPVDRKTLPKNRARLLTREELAARREQAKARHAEWIAEKEMAEVEKADGQKEVSTAAASGTEAMIPMVNEKPAEETGQTFIAFARIFSGTLKKGQKLYVLGPKHDTRKALEELAGGDCVDESLTLKDLSRDQHMTCFNVSDLFMFMGRELEALKEVPAGNILGIGGLEEHILNSATVSSTVACPAFTEMHFEAKPIVRVAVEPKKPSCLGQLLKGLKLLNQADPCVETLLQETGEHVIIAAGEVHLQRCLDDLRERYAQIEINVSPAIVPFRETVIDPPKLDMVNEAILQDSNQKSSDDANERDGLVEIKTSDKTCTLKIKAVALPTEVTRLLDENAELIKTMDQYNWFSEKCVLQRESELTEEAIKLVVDLKKKLEAGFEESENGDFWKGAVDLVWAFGPRSCGPNILLNRIQGYNRPSVWTCVQKDKSTGPLREYDKSVVSGFQLATLSGPLCEEPVMGVCFIIEGWEVEETVLDVTEQGKDDISSALSKVTLDEVCKCEAGSDRIITLGVNTSICAVCSRLKSSWTLDDDKTSVSSAGTSMSKKHSYGPFTGQLMTAVKNGCRRAFQLQPQRLMAAIYTCQIQATAETLGKLYAVIGKRGGRILSEDLQEGSNMFNIEATLPVVESFGLAEEIRKRTSGLASPQLKFSHWEVVDIDPYWEPKTEEELLHFGEKADSENKARKYMNDVRRRKGLKVKEQLVMHAEKQRTLKKNV